MHCLNQRKWRDPRDMRRHELEEEIRVITDLVKKTEFEIQNYRSIYSRYHEWKAEDDKIAARSGSLYAELRELRRGLFSKFFRAKEIEEVSRQLSEVHAQFEKLIKRFHEEDPICNPVTAEFIPVGHYKNFLAWTISTQPILPWDTQQKLLYGQEVDEIYSYEELMPPNDGIQWLIENELRPLKDRLSALKSQVSARG